MKLTCSGSLVCLNVKRKGELKKKFFLNFWSITPGCSRTRMAYKVFPFYKCGRTPWADWLAFPPLSGWWMCFAHREFSDEISIIKHIFPNRHKYTHLSLTQPTLAYFRYSKDTSEVSFSALIVAWSCVCETMRAWKPDEKMNDQISRVAPWVCQK